MDLNNFDNIMELAIKADPTLVKVLGESSARNFIWHNGIRLQNMQAFTQMIVKECADVIAPMGDWCGGHGEPSMPSTMECAKRLKKHFGVEE